MKFIRPVLGVALSLMFGVALAAAQADPHHPESASASAKSVAAMPASAPAKDATKKMDDQMKMMHDMHEKLMNAKTPEERSALMADHMKMMQGGMAMMGNMKNIDADAKNKMKGKMPADMDKHQMMEKRMEMMESMMQMMMDRMPATSPAPAK